MQKWLPYINALPHLKHVILMDTDTPEPLHANVTFHSFQSISEAGKKHLLPPVIAPGDAYFTLMYTSGSTGNPKAVPSTYYRWNYFISQIYFMTFPLVRLSFMLLSHTTERQLIYITLCFGGKVVFSRGDMTTIFEDFQIVNPTMLSAPPRFYDQIYNNYLASLMLLEKRKDLEMTHSEMEEYALSEIRGILGNGLQSLMIGGAASGDKIKHFLAKCFQVRVFDGYGSSEAGGIATDGHIFPNTQIKIEECPELGLKHEESVFRGVLWVKTNVTIEGYYKDPVATAENLRDGWFNTGDLVEFKEGRLRVLDRKKFYFKLAQGFFVSPSSIEEVYLQNPFIEQLIVYGDPFRSDLVSVIVPNKHALENWAKRKHIDKDFKALCLDERCIQKIMKQIDKMSKKEEFRLYMIPTRIFLTDVEWTQWNGLMTQSNKLLRTAIETLYKEEIEEMYSCIKREQLEALVKEFEKSDNVIENGTLRATDSLTMVQIWMNLKKKLGYNIPITKLFDNEGNLDLANTLEGDNIESSVDIISADLKLNVGSPKNTTLSSEDGSKRILLTGATGFLGAHLLVELIKNTSHQIYCLIRCIDEAEGRDKLGKVLQTYDLPKSTKDRVFIVPGDLTAPQLGLGSLWNELVNEIDIIYHSAAQVNWIVSYKEIRVPNVLGTLEVIHFVNEGRRKQLFHISSISTVGYERHMHDLEHLETIGNPYGLTKYISEKIVLKAFQQGVEGVIFRPGMITASSITGASNPTDFVSRYFLGITTSRKYFKSDANFDMMPVDLVAQTIRVLSEDPNQRGNVCNVRNTTVPTYTEIADILQTVMTCPLQLSSFEDWISIISQDIENAFYPMIPFVSLEDYSLPSGIGSSSFTVSETYIKKVMEYLRRVA